MFTEQLPCNRFIASYYGNIQMNIAEHYHFKKLTTTKCCKSMQESEIDSGWERNRQVKMGNLRKINGEGFKKHLKQASQNKQILTLTGKNTQ